jgi:hypothetical protein
MLNLNQFAAPVNGEVTTSELGLGKLWKRSAPWLLLVALLVPPIFSELVLAVAPSPLVYALYGATAGFIQFKAFTLSRRRQLVGLLVWVGALLVLHLVPWNSRKVFLAQFDRVESGMSVEQVHSILAPVSISPERQTELGVRGYRHSDAARFDSDIGVVRFTDGRVTETEFLPD